MNRKAGTASVEEHPKGSGVYRVRARIGKRLVSIASKLDQATANATADAYALLRSEGELREGITLSQFGAGFLDRREKLVRGARKDRSRWKTHVDADPIGGIALRLLRRSDVVEWRDRLQAKGLARQTRRNARNLLSKALVDALDRELVTENVARDVMIPRGVQTESLEDLSGIMNPAEQVKLLKAIPEALQPLVEVALFTGLRWSELSWLRWEDVTEDEIAVRRSTAGGPTKSEKVRRVPLLPPAAAALKAQRALVPKSSPWVFPSAEGTPRQNRPNAWPEWVAAAELGRHVRWHDLRHTCGTSLLAGWWGGERWTLDEVCRFLGHSEIATTERYARKLDQTVRSAVAKTFPGGNGNDASPRHDWDAIVFLNRRSPVRFRPGAPQKNRQFIENDPRWRGTFWELPRALRKALRATGRSVEGVRVRRLAVAYEASLRGDELGALREFLLLERAAGRRSA